MKEAMEKGGRSNNTVNCPGPRKKPKNNDDNSNNDNERNNSANSNNSNSNTNVNENNNNQPQSNFFQENQLLILGTLALLAFFYLYSNQYEYD